MHLQDHRPGSPDSAPVSADRSAPDLAPSPLPSLAPLRGNQRNPLLANVGAEAYTSGSSLTFAARPELSTTAHEAAHVVQQRAGVQL